MSMALRMKGSQSSMRAAINRDGEIVIHLENGAGGVEIVKPTPGFLESMMRAAMQAAALRERQSIQRNAEAATARRYLCESEPIADGGRRCES